VHDPLTFEKRRPSPSVDPSKRLLYSAGVVNPRRGSATDLAPAVYGHVMPASESSIKVAIDSA